jgi:hypothetical protein
MLIVFEWKFVGLSLVINIGLSTISMFLLDNSSLHRGIPFRFLILLMKAGVVSSVEMC